jgi:hypothetical protein
MPSSIWDERCRTFLTACEAFVAEHRNKYSVDLHDAIRARVTPSPLVVGKNASTMQMLNRVDDVLAAIAKEVEYE